SAAVKQADISRSAFYKYKDSIFDADEGRELITLVTLLRDETGALQQLLTCISESGASVVTINQSTPENSTANVSVAIRTSSMHVTLAQLLDSLHKQPMIIDVARR
ncbi:MAG: ACT domain-containing protein, partial [Oscillospiraceae bacterium]